MADNNDWMPGTWGGKAAMFANIEMKLPGHQTALGLTNAERQEAVDICNEFEAVFDFDSAVQAWAAGIKEWRDLAMFGDPVGTNLLDPTVAPVYVAPGTSIVGLLRRFRRIRDSWVKAAGYIDAIGEDLMIVKTDGGVIPPPTPTIAVSGAQHNYLFSVNVTGRDDADQWVVFTRQKGGGWVNAGTYTGKSVDITIIPLSPGDPEMVEVFVQLRKDNADYGTASQIATVTVLP